MSTDQPTAKSATESVAEMKKRFLSLERSADSLSWAAAAYRLGMATAEQPSAHPEQNLREALGHYQQAAKVLTIERAPVEHARVLNAAGSAHRMLGDPGTASRLFREALGLMAGRGFAAEEASVLNNLGLVLSEGGYLDDAIDAFTKSLEMVPGRNDEQVRTILATKHNLGQVHLASGGLDGCNAAIAVLSDAATTARGTDASMHTAMIDHSLGIAWKAKATHDPDALDHHIGEAIVAFQQCLTVFTSVGFPMQHAIAKHNLGHALAAKDDVASLQRAIAHYEDALNIFDPRLHQQLWQEAFVNAEAVETRLELVAPGATRADHIATLAGSMDDTERLMFVRQRLAQMERLPKANQIERLTEWSYAVITQPPESFVASIRTLITVLMELPETLLESALESQLAAHAMLDKHDQRAADFVLDEAINALLFGPQRIRVRDILEDIGWDRP
ncbi:MAG: tetratricopeptide repeat protein [Actinobacteria bacterium]|nr:tetratricopeptide repeat protein [Actinomycetota bacterium]